MKIYVISGFYTDDSGITYLMDPEVFKDKESAHKFLETVWDEAKDYLSKEMDSELTDNALHLYYYDDNCAEYEIVERDI